MLNVPRLQLAFSGQIANVRMECQARIEVVRLQIVLLHHFLSNKPIALGYLQVESPFVLKPT